jgi:hypothetical protein
VFFLSRALTHLVSILLAVCVSTPPPLSPHSTLRRAALRCARAGTLLYGGVKNLECKSYEGEWRHNAKEGQGTQVYANDEIFQGVFEAGLRKKGKGTNR